MAPFMQDSASKNKISIKEFIHSDKFKEIIRFAIVGVIATAIQYGIYLLLKQWINLKVAYTIGYIISFLFNFWLSNVFTFKTQASVQKGVGFAASHAINYLLHIVLLSVFIKIGIPEDYAPIPVFCIAIPVNFILVRTALKKL